MRAYIIVKNLIGVIEMKAILIFKDEEGEKFDIELRSDDEKALRREARKEIVAYCRVGCELIDYTLEEE